MKAMQHLFLDALTLAADNKKENALQFPGTVGRNGACQRARWLEVMCD